MSMDKLIADVEHLIDEEYDRASIKFGATNHSDHESYAVLLEELEEAQSEVAEVHFQLQHFWQSTKANDDDLDKYSRLLEAGRRAKLAACELVQVAAMFKKAAETVKARRKIGDNL